MSGTTTTTLTCTRRLAVVASESPFTIYLGGDTSNFTPAVALDSYTPHGGDVVVVLEAGGDYIVIGSVAGQGIYTQPGIVVYWGNASATPPPNGWLLCNGAAVSRTTYSRLYSTVGTTWGAGDGSTTFNLPNLVGFFVKGASGADNVAYGSSTHQHTLSSIGYAKMQMSASTLEVAATSVSSWTGTVKASSFSGVAASDSLSQGVQLGGLTDNAGNDPSNKLMAAIIKT